ncbi:hypothetical protein ACFVAD_17570 [Sutcliffiella sp. NPDC057660]
MNSFDLLGQHSYLSIFNDNLSVSGHYRSTFLSNLSTFGMY